MKLLCLIVLFSGLCHGVSKATQCVARGRYPNNEVEDCRGYTMCLIGGVSGFTEYKLICPVSFAYSHLEYKCTNATNYKCVHNYVCHTVGNFVNPISTNCSSYIACPKGIVGIGMARQVECPSGEVFSSIEGACVSSGYTCSANITTEVVPELPVTESQTEVPVTVNVQMSRENGFHASSSISVNVCNTHILYFALLVFVYVNN